MKERILKSVVNVFALIANYKTHTNFFIIQNLVEIYLSTKFSYPTQQYYLHFFTERYVYYDDKKSDRINAIEHFIQEEVEAECYILNRELDVAEKIIFFINLLEFYPFLKHQLPIVINNLNDIENVFQYIAQKLSIKENTYKDCQALIFDNFYQISQDNKLLIFSDNEGIVIRGVKHECAQQIKGVIIFLELTDDNIVLFKVKGESKFEVNNQLIYKRRVYSFKEGAVILVDNSHPIYYNDVIKKLRSLSRQPSVFLVADQLQFTYKKSTNGLKPLNFVAASGHFIAIMGTSGSGKTTLLNILNGNIKPDAGWVKINGIDVHQRLNLVKGYIGYVPQDDTLIEELTVYQNLYLTAKLSLGNYNNEALHALVKTSLDEFELLGIKHLKIGKPNEKVISGGQRKRLNIALELIRNPLILFLDEPTSGLSSFDSDKVMLLLKKITQEGRIVIVNIHQPSSYIFKLFDKLLFIDQQGYPVYYGDTLKALPYFKNAFNLVDSHVFECLSCGNVNPNELFHVIQTPTLISKENGTRSRIKSPEKWHRYFLRKQKEESTQEHNQEHTLPQARLKVPNVFKQFLVYTYRDLSVKTGNFQSLSLAIVIVPLLAFILSMFCKQYDIETGNYQYATNENISIYLLMGVVVALFVGLVNSAEEILKDRKLLKREAFIDLNKTSYLLAKISILFALSFIQMGTFVLTGNWILQIKEMEWSFFVILWTTACFSNLLGLFISTLFQTRAAVYITIPFLLIPQILLAGSVLEYDKLSKWFTTDKNVPLVGNLMVSRWAYEAMIVKIYKDNRFEKQFYKLDTERNHYSYIQNFYIPELQELLYLRDTNNKVARDSVLLDKALYDGICYLQSALGMISDVEMTNPVNQTDVEDVILEARSKGAVILEALRMKRDSISEQIGDSLYTYLYDCYYNEKLAALVLKDERKVKVLYSNGKLIRRFRPIYDFPDNSMGMAHFYSPYKRIGNWLVETPHFNVSMIWLFSLVLFFLISVSLHKT